LYFWREVLSLKDHPTLAGTFGLSAAALSALTTFLNPEARAGAHSAAGAAYLALKNRARIFSNIQLLSAQDTSAKEATFAEIAARREELNSGSPEIPRWALKRPERASKQARTSIARIVLSSPLPNHFAQPSLSRTEAVGQLKERGTSSK
jgi:hypothetical protein